MVYVSSVSPMTGSPPFLHSISSSIRPSIVRVTSSPEHSCRTPCIMACVSLSMVNTGVATSSTVIVSLVAHVPVPPTSPIYSPASKTSNVSSL